VLGQSHTIMDNHLSSPLSLDAGRCPGIRVSPPTTISSFLLPSPPFHGSNLKCPVRPPESPSNDRLTPAPAYPTHPPPNPAPRPAVLYYPLRNYACSIYIILTSVITSSSLPTESSWNPAHGGKHCGIPGGPNTRHGSSATRSKNERYCRSLACFMRSALR